MAIEGIRLTERTIPIPESVSREARQALALEPALGRTIWPPLEDKAAWRAAIQRVNDEWESILRESSRSLPVSLELRHIAGVPTYVAEPQQIPRHNEDKALLSFHGGGLVIMGGECVRHFAAMEAVANRCRVFAVDYRNPPDHPYPAALEDGVTVYRDLLRVYPPLKLAISGVSGGGNLAAAVPLKLRDLGIALPGAVGLFTPEVDLTESGDTFQTLRDIDAVLPHGLPALNALYAGGHDLRDPYVSPLFGDFSRGFPPTFIQSGTRDLLLSNSVRMHRALRRAGIVAELHVGEAMPHGGFGGAPEDLELREEFLRFLARTADWAPV
jgi:acetyl esterase/lipase